VKPAADGGASVRVRIRNTGARAGREVVQIYLVPEEPGDRPERWLAGFANVEAGAGEAVEASVVIDAESASVWDDGWQHVGGRYTVEASHSFAEPRLTTVVELGKTG
jgi:beta-glucosidase